MLDPLKFQLHLLPEVVHDLKAEFPELHLRRNPAEALLPRPQIGFPAGQNTFANVCRHQVEQGHARSESRLRRGLRFAELAQAIEQGTPSRAGQAVLQPRLPALARDFSLAHPALFEQPPQQGIYEVVVQCFLAKDHAGLVFELVAMLGAVKHHGQHYYVIHDSVSIVLTSAPCQLGNSGGRRGRSPVFLPAIRESAQCPLCGYNGPSMIAHLRGKLLAKHPNQVIVETGGVGYEVTISVPTFSGLPPVGSDVALHTYTQVREDVLALYGFLHPAEKRLFEKLIMVSGIGPRLAITILSGMAADELAAAIRGNDLARLTRIPGVGKKTAERMVLELRDKLPASVAAAAITPSLSELENDVVSALENLGYQRAAAEKALQAAAKNGKSASFDALFREALGALSK